MRTRDNDKEEIVKKMAIATIAKDGLEGFTIAKLAKACNISVGTPYIYYKDKNDLIIKIVLEETAKMEQAMNKDFDPAAALEDGLRLQWFNRINYTKQHPLIGRFFDQISSSVYQDQLLEMFNGNPATMLNEFKQNIETFISNAVKNKELASMSYEEYWCIAFSPLYSLLSFQEKGRSITGQPFQLSDEIVWATFKRVLKALKN